MSLIKITDNQSVDPYRVISVGYIGGIDTADIVPGETPVMINVDMHEWVATYRVTGRTPEDITDQINAAIRQDQARAQAAALSLPADGGDANG